MLKVLNLNISQNVWLNLWTKTESYKQIRE